MSRMFLIIFSCLLAVCLQDVRAECPAIISKKEWDGDKPKHRLFLTTPVNLIVIQHTVTQTCSDDQSCASVVRDIQKTHVNEAFLWDIGPSFLIGSTGKIYEGRGWHHVGVHTYGFNNHSIGVAFIGNFNNHEPSAKALEAARALIQCGVEQDALTADHKVVVHSQLLSTESPGKKLARKIKSWIDWVEDVREILKQVDIEDVKITDNTPDDSSDYQVKQSSEPERRPQILTTVINIDANTVRRNVISELIDNIFKIAKQTLKTVEDLLKRLADMLDTFIEKLTSDLRLHKDRINTVAVSISSIPGVEKCSIPIQQRANIIYEDTERKAKSCAEQRTKEVEDIIRNLDSISNNAIKFANTAVEETRNCTELSYGIESSTKACLNSVTQQTRRSSSTFETQRSLVLETIRSTLSALPAALDLCSKKYLLDASTETTKMTTQLMNCKPTLFPGW